MDLGTVFGGVVRLYMETVVGGAIRNFWFVITTIFPWVPYVVYGVCLFFIVWGLSMVLPPVFRLLREDDKKGSEEAKGTEETEEVEGSADP